MNSFVPIHANLTNRLLRNDCIDRATITPYWRDMGGTSMLEYLPYQDSPAHSGTSAVVNKPDQVRHETFMGHVLEVGQDTLGLRGSFRGHTAETFYSNPFSFTYLAAFGEASIAYAKTDRRLLGELDLECAFSSSAGLLSTVYASFLVTEANTGGSMQDVRIATDPERRFSENAEEYYRVLESPYFNQEYPLPDLPNQRFHDMQRTDDAHHLTSDATLVLAGVVLEVLDAWDHDQSQ